MTKKIIVFFVLIFSMLIFADSEISFTTFGSYENTLEIYFGGWAFQLLEKRNDLEFKFNFNYVTQYFDNNNLESYITMFQAVKELDLDRSNFFKFEMEFKNDENFDPLLTRNTYTLRQNWYHIFNIRNYIKVQVMQQYSDYFNTNVLDYYRLGLFAKTITRATNFDSIFLGLNLVYSHLPGWSTDEYKNRDDLIASLIISFSRNITRNLRFNLSYQYIYNYSSAKVPQLDIKYFYIELPEDDESRQIAVDFYRYYSNNISVEMFRFFTNNFYARLLTKFESKEYIERKAFRPDGHIKNELERDFNISASFSLIRKNIPFRNMLSILELKYEDKSSNNEYEGFTYYNIRRYFINLNFVYMF